MHESGPAHKAPAQSLWKCARKFRKAGVVMTIVCGGLYILWLIFAFSRFAQQYHGDSMDSSDSMDGGH